MVIITIMVLEKAPDRAVNSVLLPIGPTAVSCDASYPFIAIIWLNHHYLLRSGFAERSFVPITNPAY